jgi:cytochrome b561
MHSSVLSSPSGTTRKPALSLAAHWLSALAIVMAFGLVWSRDLLDSEILRAALLNLHRQFGLVVLVLWGIRLLARWLQPPSDSAVVLPWLLRWMAAASHAVLYLVLLAMPLLGWAMTSAQGHPVALFNVLPLPALVAINPDLADTLQEWHEGCAWVLLGLVSLHILAALWHHWVRRDGVLAGMLPMVKVRESR